MTDREKAIVMAYTGKCMLTGDKLSEFYKYVESIMGRTVYTHEMAIKAIDDEIKEKSKADFIALCADESSSEKPNKWISADVIEKIKAEITEISVEEIRIEEKWARGLHYAIKVIDKYISPTGAESEGV